MQCLLQERLIGIHNSENFLVPLSSMQNHGFSHFVFQKGIFLCPDLQKMVCSIYGDIDIYNHILRLMVLHSTLDTDIRKMTIPKQEFMRCLLEHN